MLSDGTYGGRDQDTYIRVLDYSSVRHICTQHGAGRWRAESMYVHALIWTRIVHDRMSMDPSLLFMLSYR